ncbi:aspartate carbamoyltransferase regulatory subunit [Acidianus sp. RZ1]|uniref:aspartate carbamoyltransferase regulatory subunit n=1 Tax=Acidianus sp. RZ1 TaxID=1540082 RepID=UPI00149281E1|nr:aspartate carbamoyltransferase regulatory subunit [Acidianus sp. RZ1]NON62785.1 aspartate carbamoyltransferase regulatory subunit [Acidianus sp. RZ1]
MENGLIVTKIKDGTVIDHIPAGRALAVLKILGIKGNEGNRVALVMNVDSHRIGKKDIVKIEERVINNVESELITLIAPNATINIIKNYEVAEKRKLRIPDIVVGILKCQNPLCITNNDPEGISKFSSVSKVPIVLKCDYCDTELTEDDVLRQILS